MNWWLNFWQDYHWWWRSFLTSGFTAVYLFGYCIHYFVSKLEIHGAASTFLYFGYTFIIVFLFFLLTGETLDPFFIQYIYIYPFNLSTFICSIYLHLSIMLVYKPRKMLIEKRRIMPKIYFYFKFKQNTHVYFFLLIVFKVQLVSLLVSGLSPRFTESSKSTKDLTLSVLWRNHLLWYKQQTIEKKFKKKKEKKKGWKNSHCLSDYYMDLLNILLWLYVQVLCNLFKGKQIDNLKA